MISAIVLAALAMTLTGLAIGSLLATLLGAMVQRRDITFWPLYFVWTAAGAVWGWFWWVVMHG